MNLFKFYDMYGKALGDKYLDKNGRLKSHVLRNFFSDSSSFLCSDDWVLFRNINYLQHCYLAIRPFWIQLSFARYRCQLSIKIVAWNL